MHNFYAEGGIFSKFQKKVCKFLYIFRFQWISMDFNENKLCVYVKMPTSKTTDSSKPRPKSGRSSVKSLKSYTKPTNNTAKTGGVISGGEIDGLNYENNNNDNDNIFIKEYEKGSNKKGSNTTGLNDDDLKAIDFYNLINETFPVYSSTNDNHNTNNTIQKDDTTIQHCIRSTSGERTLNPCKNIKGHLTTSIIFKNSAFKQKYKNLLDFIDEKYKYEKNNYDPFFILKPLHEYLNNIHRKTLKSSEHPPNNTNTVKTGGNVVKSSKSQQNPTKNAAKTGGRSVKSSKTSTKPTKNMVKTGGSPQNLSHSAEKSKKSLKSDAKKYGDSKYTIGKSRHNGGVLGMYGMTDLEKDVIFLKNKVTKIDNGAFNGAESILQYVSELWNQSSSKHTEVINDINNLKTNQNNISNRMNELMDAINKTRITLDIKGCESIKSNNDKKNNLVQLN